MSVALYFYVSVSVSPAARLLSTRILAKRTICGCLRRRNEEPGKGREEGGFMSLIIDQYV
jgi:hypothetical protein